MRRAEFASVVPECETKINQFRITGRQIQSTWSDFSSPLVLGAFAGAGVDSHIADVEDIFCFFFYFATFFFSIRENIYARGNVS